MIVVFIFPLIIARLLWPIPTLRPMLVAASDAITAN